MQHGGCAVLLDTLQTRILRGRAFAESDDEHAPRVVVINQTMAARYWPGEDAIGKRLRIGAQDSTPWEVVGIAEDGKYVSVSEKPLPYFYVPMAQSPISMRVLQVALYRVTRRDERSRRAPRFV